MEMAYVLYLPKAKQGKTFYLASCSEQFEQLTVFKAEVTNGEKHPVNSVFTGGVGRGDMTI